MRRALLTLPEVALIAATRGMLGAGIGMFLLGRAWNQTTVAALLAGLLYSLNGFLIAHLEHLNILVG